ncbi:unnamed protein product, partial [Rotaria sp. Silwood1]
RPKNTSTNYTVRIDIYEKNSFEFRGTWAFSIQFLFLPVHRTAVQLHIPPTKAILQGQETEKCGNHGHYLQYVNTNGTFCKCDKGCVLQENYHSSANITSVITRSKRCLPIIELFNTTIVTRHLLRRIKLYHMPCQQRTKLDCFYDETHMCICNHDLQQANCFNFNHNMTYNCKGKSLCENEGRCFYDKPDCPTLFMCVCDECSYGSRCQFSTKGFAVSRDTILGYHIKPDGSFGQQRVSIKITVTIAMIMLVCGLANSVLSIMTFQTKKMREVGCGCYLLVSSYTSAIVFILFALKFYFLIASHMNIITNRIFLSLNCILIDFLIKILVNIIDWLTTCVGIERTVVTYQEKKLDKAKTKRIAKWIIIFIFVLTITTNLQDLINRHLMDDEEENRTWCI